MIRSDPAVKPSFHRVGRNPSEATMAQLKAILGCLLVVALFAAAAEAGPGACSKPGGPGCNEVMFYGASSEEMCLKPEQFSPALGNPWKNGCANGKAGDKICVCMKKLDCASSEEKVHRGFQYVCGSCVPLYWMPDCTDTADLSASNSEETHENE